MYIFVKFKPNTFSKFIGFILRIFKYFFGFSLLKNCIVFKKFDTNPKNTYVFINFIPSVYSRNLNCKKKIRF